MTIEELDELASSTAGSFVTKSATLEARAGNPEPRYTDLPLGSIHGRNRGVLRWQIRSQEPRYYEELDRQRLVQRKEPLDLQLN